MPFIITAALLLFARKMKMLRLGGTNDLSWDIQLISGGTDILLRLWIVQKVRAVEPDISGLEAQVYPLVLLPQAGDLISWIFKVKFYYL